MRLNNDKRIQVYTKGNKIIIKYWNVNGEPQEFEYWVPPTQSASVYKPWTYSELIAEYDKLMNNSNGYIKKKRYEIDGEPVLTINGNYELFSYTLEPSSYSKTIFISAGVHGNEMDAKQQLLRFVDILVNKVDTPGYERFKRLKNDCKLVIIPCISPYGHDTSSMNIPYTFDETATHGINLNRNYDFNHQWALASAGVGGDRPFEFEEVQHVRDVLKDIGYANINYAMDWHDGGSVTKHYWVNYTVDSKLRKPVVDFINYLVETHNIENPSIEECKDTSTTGTFAGYVGKTLGISGGTVEWIGGYLGYSFNESQMTQSMEIRANCVLFGYEMDLSSWVIEEPSNARYFHFDYPKAFTMRGLRKDASEERTKVTHEQIYSRWDNLVNNYPNLITKSNQLGVNADGEAVFTYTFGNGDNKILYVGGILRYGATHKIDEFAIYSLIEYLCNDDIVNQSKFLQELKNNYTIIILPCIDNTAANNATYKYSGLNNMALSYKKWQIVDGKCQPTSNALTYNDIPILKNIIDNNTDLKCIISGGEDCTKYSGNSQDYTTEFETQIIIPLNQNDDTTEYAQHLINDRNEDVIIEHTKGTTFGDYAYDNFGIRTYYIQLHVSKRFTELADYHTLTEDEYMHGNYESGRRMANIVNLMLL